MQKIIALIHKLQPGTLVNDRGRPLTEKKLGDFVTPERFIPRPLLTDHHPYLECCDAMGLNSWGYAENERFWSAPELIRRLSEVAACGGNYLLNVEPAPDGTVRPECVARMKALGTWLKTNAVAVFDSGKCLLKPVDPTFDYPEIGVSTKQGNTVYLHLHQWPRSDVVLVPHCQGTVKKAVLTDTKQRLTVTHQKEQKALKTGSATPGGLLITNLPPIPPATPVPVIKLEFHRPPAIRVGKIIKAFRQVVRVPPGETVYLRPKQAERWNPDGVPWQQIHHYPNGAVTIGSFSVALKSRTIWRLQIEKPGKYMLATDLGTAPRQANAKFAVSIAGQTLTAINREIGRYDVPQRMTLGVVRLRAGRQKLELRILKSAYSFSDLHALILIPCP